MPEAKEAERLSKQQRIDAGRWLLVDESKITSPKDMMYLHRVRAAAVERSDAFDAMLREPDVNRLLSEGAIYIERD